MLARSMVVAVLGCLGLGILQAQGPSGTAGPDVTVSGCIAQAQRSGSLADDTGAGTAATPNSAPAEANSAELVDAYLLTNADPVGADKDLKRAAPTSYTLEGREQEISKHKGHRVEVTGSLLPPRAAAGAPQVKAAAPGIKRIAVRSLKMLSAECPAKAG